MQRKWGGETCCVPSCYRRSKKEVPFCERCWSVATDEERTGVLFGQHAPFWGRRAYFLEPDDVSWSLLGIPQQRESKYGAAAIESSYATEKLGEFEARSTREAVAAEIARRRGADIEALK